MNATITIPPWAKFIVSDHTDMDRNPHPVDAGKVRSFTLKLPDDVYFEYGFLDEDGAMRPNPENETRADNPWYPELSAIIGPDYQPDPYAVLNDKEAGESRRLRLESAHLKMPRRLIAYTPKGHEDEALPVIYLKDGVAYYRIANLPLVLDKLLAEGMIRPAHLVFLEPGDRLKEYSFNPDYARFFLDEALPLIERELKTTDERLVMGASLGGLAGATLAWEHPELFSTVIAQSGAFLGTPENPDHYRSEDSWLLEQVKREESKPLRWYLDCGKLEWLLEVSRELAQALKEKGYEVRQEERNAGHNWVNWRNGLSGALRFALSQ